MANVKPKNGIFYIRFRFRGQQFKKSLKTTSASDAKAACKQVEFTIYRLTTGQIQIPESVDAGDFIVAGGVLPAPKTETTQKPTVPSLMKAAEEFLESRRHKNEESYRSTQRIHLGHLQSALGAERCLDRILPSDLDACMADRLKKVRATTVNRERGTFLRFFRWTVKKQYLVTSPATDLEVLLDDFEPQSFKTTAEITEIIDRGGLSEKEVLALWECLYLTLSEIASRLALVKERAAVDFAHLLHAIPACTGMRREEVLKLRWADIDFNRNYISARSRKQSRTRRVVFRKIDLLPELKTLLLAWRERRPKGQLVICEQNSHEPVIPDYANRCFWQPLRHTDWCLDSNHNWFKIGFHTYRHSFASNLACLGVDQRVIDEWMGHETEAMRRRYRHLFPNTKRDAILKLSLAAG